MPDWRLRFRAVLDNQFTVVVATLLVVVVLGGWATYTAHAGPATTTESKPTVSWEQTGTFDHAATVQADSSLYPSGETLENRPVYFTSLSPELDGRFRTSFDPQDSGELDQTVSLSLVIREVDQGDQGADQTVYWETTDSLAEETVNGVAPGEPVRVSFSQNMSAINAEINQIREDIGGSPGSLEVIVRATVDSQGSINGDTVDETTTYTMPLTLDSSTYSVDGAEPTVESYETTQPVAVDRDSSLLTSVGGPLLLVISLGLLGGIVVRSDRLALSEAERAALADETDRESHDDWISTIKLPPDAFELPRAEADSLAALVDFAIDTDNCVIEDPDETVYYVRHDGYLYSYRPTVADGVDDETEPTNDGSVVDEQGDNDGSMADKQGDNGGSMVDDTESTAENESEDVDTHTDE